MGAKYVITDTQAITATPGDTVLLLDQNGANGRGRIFEIDFGDIGTPDDQAQELLLRKSTATGTGDALVETINDPADIAPLLEGTGNHSSEPTYTANTELLDVGVNSRSTFRLITVPEAAFVIPATDNAGIGLTAIGGGATLHAATLAWEE